MSFAGMDDVRAVPSRLYCEGRLMGEIVSIEPEVATRKAIVRVQLPDGCVTRLRVPGPATFGSVLDAMIALERDRVP